MPDAEGGEGDGERRGQEEEARPRDNRRSPGGLYRERGHEQHAGADERAHVEGGSANHAQVPVFCQRGEASGELGPILTAIAA